MKKEGGSFLVEPRDGVRARFSAVTAGTRFTIEMERDGFAQGKKINVSKSMRRVSFILENQSGDDHKTLLSLTSGGKARVKIDGKRIRQSEEKNGSKMYLLPVSSDNHVVKIRLKHRRNVSLI